MQAPIPSSPADWAITLQSREELESLLDNAATTAGRAQLLLKLAARMFRSDYDRAWEQLTEGIELAGQINDPHGLLEGYSLMGDLLCYRGNYREALQSVELAEEYLPERNPSPAERGRIDGVRGKILCSSGRFTEAAPFLTSALNIFKTLGDIPGIVRISSTLSAIYSTFWMYEEAMELLLYPLSLIEEQSPSLYHATLYNGIATLHSMLNDHREAADYCRKAYDCYRQIGDKYGTAIALLNLGLAYEEQTMWEESLGSYLEALPIARKGEPALLAILLMNIGTVYEHTGRFDEALEYELLALSIINGSERTAQHYRILRCLGRLYAKMGRFDEAEEHLLEGLRHTEEAEDIDSQYQFHGELAAYYSLIGNPAAALQHAQRGNALVAGAAGADALGKVVRLMAQHELKRMRREHENLADRVSLLEEENRRQAQKLTAASLQAAHHQEVLVRLKKVTDRSATGDHGELVSLLRTILNTEVGDGSGEGWQQFEQGFERLHPEFTATLARCYPSISPAELKIATLLKIGLSTKEIADVLCISLHTANTHRRRLRRKLELPEGANLTSFLASFSMNVEG